ncbi:MAG TPA: TonB C-terminal domain-containing protein [Polyangiaceae bacterium]|nr:TonB C-terminal domain-containing protein [Polyangiaceae bacterium]
MAVRAFLPQELALSVFLTAVVETGLVLLIVIAGQNKAKVVAHEAEVKEEVPIAVKPVMDDLPLLKLGGKKVKAKLPDMWTKQAPVQRFTETSAPSTKAAKTPEAIPTTPLAKADAAPPPPDAALAKEVDQPLTDAAPKPEANLPTEGAADGVKEGTETDPLKARAANLYRAKLIAWFQARFQAPSNLPCDVVHALSAAASISVGSDRTITGATMSRASNNADFDARVKTALDNFVGQQLPPPPPLYPDLSPGSLLTPSFSGKTAPCADSSPAPSPAPAPAPAPETVPAPPPAPAPESSP